MKKIEYELTRKNIKKMYIRVRSDGTVSVSAPKYASKSRIDAFVQNNKDWILNQQKQAELKSQQPIHNFNDGEIFYLWGREYTLKLISGTSDAITVSDDCIIFETECCEKEKIQKCLYNWYSRLLSKQIDEFLIKYENLTGLTCSSYKIKDLKSKWGSCNIISKELMFNFQLVKLPRDCLEYVVLHELCHIKVPNHSAQFKAELFKYNPNWKLADKALSSYIVNKGV